MKYRRYIPEEIPPWVIPCEVLRTIPSIQGEGWIPYGELIKIGEGKEMYLKKEKELPYEYNWLEYMQIKDLFKKGKEKKGLTLSDLEKIILETEKKLISKLYKKLLEWFLEVEQVKEYMIKCSINFNRTIELEKWEFLWKKSNKISTCYMIKENIFKLHTRWYMTPYKLNRMNPTLSNKCWKCQQMEGTMYHMWWGCNKTKEFWKIIHEAIIKILGYEINKLPELYLLGLRMEEIPSKDRTLF